MLVHCRVPNSTNRVSDASAALGLGMDPIDFNCKPPSAPQQFVSKVSLQGSHKKDINRQVLTKEFDVQMLDIPIEIKVGYFPIGFVPPQKWSFDLSCVRKLFICVHFFLSFFMPEKFAWTGRLRTISTSLLLRGGPRPAEFSPLTMIHCAPIGRATASSRSSKVGLPPEPSAAPTQSWDMLGQFLNGMHMHMQVWYSNIGLENQESQKGHHLDMLVFKVQRL